MGICLEPACAIRAGAKTGIRRIDEIVVFHPLGKEHLAKIVEIQLRRVTALLAEKGYRLEVTKAAGAYLAEAGYDPTFGARPLKRAIQRELQDPLALKILSGDFKEGDKIKVDRGKDGLTFTAAAADGSKAVSAPPL
jgi:ATP-dependent Clp protease ATP-binding subunit ClpB